MKKMLAVLTVMSSFTGLNVQAEEATPLSVGFGVDQGFSVLIQFDEKMNLAVGNDGVAFDYIFKKGSFESEEFPFTWYVGGGGWVGWGDHGDQFGARLPLGLDWDFAANWDAYGQIHPQLKYNTKSDDFDLGMGASVGIRYAF